MPDEPREQQEFDVDTDDGFNAMLAKQVGSEEPSEEQPEAAPGSGGLVSAGLTYEESSEQPRDEQGRFAPKEQPAEEPVAEAVEGVAPAEGEEEQDPLVTLAASLLGKHEGDAEAALADAAQQLSNAQSHIGSQSNEVGEARRAAEAQARENQELRERLARLEGAQQAQQQSGPAVPGLPSEQDVSGIMNMAAERGWRPTMDYLANVRPDLFEVGLDMWGQDEPYNALSVKGVYDQQKAMLEQSAQQAPAEDPTIRQMRLEREVAAAVDVAKASLTQPEWNALREHLPEALASAPRMVQEALISGDPALRAQGAELLIDRAKGRVIAAATAEARANAAAASTADKTATMVATGSQRPAEGERQPGASGDKPASTEEITAAFHKKLLEVDDTSIAGGLTYGQSMVR